MSRYFILWGSINAFLAVVLGAFGAHALKHMMEVDALQTWGTAAQYQFYHALALCLIGLMLHDNPKVKPAGYLILIGIILFSGSLYGLALSQIKWLGAITPFGGGCFILGWLWLIIVFWNCPITKRN